MKLKDLAPVLRSTTGNIQFAAVYDIDAEVDLADGCSVEFAVANLGDMELVRIQAYGNYIVLNVRNARPETAKTAEPEYFGEVRWHNEDISAELELLNYPHTPDAVAIVKKDLDSHWFTDHMIGAGFEYMDEIIRSHHNELLDLCHKKED